VTIQCNILIGNPVGNRQFGRPRLRYDVIKVDFFFSLLFFSSRSAYHNKNIRDDAKALPMWM
jgi:hypothetical protein